MVIERAASSSPNCHWWIKGDGVDVTKGLWESTRGEWAGDVDLNDGQLQALYHKLQEWLLWVGGLGLQQRGGVEATRSDLDLALTDVSSDLAFILCGTCMKYPHNVIF